MSTDHGDNPILEVKQINIFSINNIKYPVLVNIKLQQQSQQMYEIYYTHLVATREK